MEKQIIDLGYCEKSVGTQMPYGPDFMECCGKKATYKDKHGRSLCTKHYNRWVKKINKHLTHKHLFKLYLYHDMEEIKFEWKGYFCHSSLGSRAVGSVFMHHPDTEWTGEVFGHTIQCKAKTEAEARKWVENKYKELKTK